jgi:hypothetical protein
MLAHHLYPIEQAGQYPVNLALADDGALAYTTPDKIVVFDLFNAASDSRLESPKVFVDALPDKQFDSLRRPDQLALAGGQILALCADGKLRAFSELTGQARTFMQDNVSTEVAVTTSQQSDQTILRLGDHYMYAFGPSAIVAYNMDKPEISWGDPQLITAGATTRQFFLGKDYALVLSPNSDGADPTAAWTMWAFSRALVSGTTKESGLMVYGQPPIDEPHGITTFQPVDGGLYYLAGDHALHYLKGNTHPAQ